MGILEIFAMKMNILNIFFENENFQNFDSWLKNKNFRIFNCI